MIPEIQITPTVKLPEIPYEDGALPTNQAELLLTLLVDYNPMDVLEIGTFFGHTTRLMAEHLPKARIHTVDLPLGYSESGDPHRDLPKDDFHLINRRVVGVEFLASPFANRIIQHFADTAIWDFGEAGSPTAFFIDGSHTYEYCKNDSEKCLALCGGAGLLIWHDCDDAHPGVVRLLEEWRALGRNVQLISGTPLAFWKAGE